VTARVLAERGRGHRVVGTARNPGAQSADGMDMLCVSAGAGAGRRIDVLVNNAGAGLPGAKTLVTRFGHASKRKLFGINIDVTTAQPSPRRSPIE
jgi:NAD(P)-dependent dehydrogenase (short-subunit alcohol dehydrogenase family)